MVRALTKGPKNHFFGFHDLCPWDSSQRYLLAMETDFIDRPPGAGDVARVCLVDLEDNNKLEVLAETRAWNFQQGARLQWVPSRTDRIIYNDRDTSGKLISVVFDIKEKKRLSELKHPIYAVSPDGDFGLGLDFDALVGGYSYSFRGRDNSSEIKNENNPYLREKRTGFIRINLETGKNEGIKIYTYDVSAKDHIPTPEENHVLTHITFNPSGSRICFIDKYRLPDGGFMQRLVAANPDGTDLHVFPGHVTHFCWRNDTELLGYGKFSPKITALRSAGFFKSPLLKPIIRLIRSLRGGLKQKLAGQSYLLFKDKTKEVRRIGVGVMTEDGHPQFSPDGRWMITDTYPDRNHERSLILYDWINEKRIDLGKFKSLPSGLSGSWDLSEMRADLHPRWSRDGKQVCIDSVDEKGRQIYAVDVGGIVA